MSHISLPFGHKVHFCKKTIKLNKYNSNNSRLIEKLAAFRHLFLKKKKKNTPNKKLELHLLQ